MGLALSCFAALHGVFSAFLPFWNPSMCLGAALSLIALHHEWRLFPKRCHSVFPFFLTSFLRPVGTFLL